MKHVLRSAADFGAQEALLAPRPVQRRGDASSTTDGVHAAATRGLSGGGGGALPHGDRIQTAFGRHDVSNVQAHSGSNANEATAAMGASAYATGSNVVLGSGGQDIHTVAHEAAHVVQQRGGVQLAGGVGTSGDAYERHADAVADAVVQGKSAEGLLNQRAGGGVAGNPVQRQQEGNTVQQDGGASAVVGTALAAASFAVQVLPNASGGLTYQNVIGQYARNTAGLHERRTSKKVCVWLNAIKGLGASWGYFDVEFEYDGNSIQSYRTKLHQATGFDGGTFGSSGSCNFQATPRGNGTEPSVEVLIAFSGDLNPSGPGYCAYDGSFVIGADGSMTLRECTITRGEAEVKKSHWFTVGW